MFAFVFAELVRSPWTGDSADTMPIRAFSDTASLGAPPSFSVTVPGRFSTAGGRTRPWNEVVAVGDTIRAGGYCLGWTPEAATPRVTCDGLVLDVVPSEVRTDDSYELTTTFVCEGLQHLLMKESVAWWMYYGSLEGWARARGELLPDDLTGRLDRVVANYLDRVVFHKGVWQRRGVGLGARVGYDLKSLDPLVPTQVNVSLLEGNHWTILSDPLDDLHELYTVVRSPSTTPRGLVHRPSVSETPNLRSEDAPQHDDGRTTVVLRPTPFPFATPEGEGDLGDWPSLPLHDFSEREPLSGAALASSARGVRNFFLVVPTTQLLNEQVAFTAGVAVKNVESIARYAYSPLKIRTNLLIDDDTTESFVDVARKLSWRLAGQHNRADSFFSTTLPLPFSPQIQPGDRIRFRAPLGDRTQVVEGYVTSRTHEWSPERGGTTSVAVERILNVTQYRDPEFFVHGLERVSVPISPLAPNARSS